MAYPHLLHVTIPCKISSMLPILGTNLWDVQTTNLLCSTFVKIVLKMFQRLRSVEHGWADSTTFSQLSFVKIKVYESWPTWRKAPQAFLDFYQQSQLKLLLLLWLKLKWQTLSISKCKIVFAFAMVNVCYLDTFL